MSTKRYSVVVRGEVDAATLARIGDPAAHVHAGLTELVCDVVDQSQLVGLLSASAGRGSRSSARPRSIRREVAAGATVRSALLARKQGSWAMSAVSPEIQLVVTKLWPPVLRPVLVPRERPLAILRSGEGCTLTLVDAPAGSGKTTALAQWLAADADRLSACWFSVDPSDNDPARFWTYAIMAVREAIPGFGDASLAALRGGADVATFVLPPAINELAAADPRLALSSTTSI